MNMLITLDVWLVTQAHFPCRCGGVRWYFYPLHGNVRYCVHKFAPFMEIEDCVGKGLFVASYTYTLPYIMHFMHLCDAKEAWWKEFHHWEMEFQLLLLLPMVMSVAGGAALHIARKSPPLQSCWALTYMAFWYFMCLFYAAEGWAGRC